MKNIKNYQDFSTNEEIDLKKADNDFAKEVLNYIKNGGKVTNISTRDSEKDTLDFGQQPIYPNQRELKFTIDNHKFSIKYEPTSYRPSLSGLLTGFKYYRFIYIDGEQYSISRSIIDDIIKEVNHTGEYVYGRSGWNDSVKLTWVKPKTKFYNPHGSGF